MEIRLDRPDPPGEATCHECGAKVPIPVVFTPRPIIQREELLAAIHEALLMLDKLCPAEIDAEVDEVRRKMRIAIWHARNQDL
jgi:hypothetical protein